MALSEQEKQAVETVKAEKARRIYARFRETLPEATWKPHSAKLVRVQAFIAGEKVLDTPVSKMLFLDDRLAGEFLNSWKPRLDKAEAQTIAYAIVDRVILGEL